MIIFSLKTKRRQSEFGQNKSIVFGAIWRHILSCAKSRDTQRVKVLNPDDSLLKIFWMTFPGGLETHTAPMWVDLAFISY